MSAQTLFSCSVINVVKNIPKGKTMSYGEVARRAGFPGAARAVGSLMKNNHDKGVPCHRVIRADGGVGQYNNGGEEVKAALLRKEAMFMK
ncbi:MAG: MGMT family protein [Patescibacteria group bacterium]|nr:MGMT family protein [Patescibacteria group bacterium]